MPLQQGINSIKIIPYTQGIQKTIRTMKKLTIHFIAAALMAGTACTSTDTTTDDTTATTDMSTEAAVTSAAGPNVSLGDLATLDDPTFVMAAASSNLFEIEAGNLAMQNASDQKVKDYARMMVDHHTMANQQLQTIASQMGVTLPQTMMDIHQVMIDKIDDKTGSEFDEDYMDTMETAHKMDITMYEAKNNNATDQNLKAYVAKTLPILQKHHQTATDTEDTVD